VIRGGGSRGRSWRLSEGRRHVAAARGDAADDAEVAEGGADEEGGAARDVCNEELHRHVLAVHVPVDIVADRLRHLARVRLEIVDVQKGRLFAAIALCGARARE